VLNLNPDYWRTGCAWVAGEGATAGSQPMAAMAATTMATSPSSRVASTKPATGIRHVSRKN
jgi:hypothetical protein